MTPSLLASSVIRSSFGAILSRCDDAKTRPSFKTLIWLSFSCLCVPTKRLNFGYSFWLQRPFNRANRLFFN